MVPECKTQIALIPTDMIKGAVRRFANLPRRYGLLFEPTFRCGKYVGDQDIDN